MHVAILLTCEVVEGKSPPPIRTMPPTAVSPEIAFVTDINGECKAGVTPQTVCATITASLAKYLFGPVATGCPFKRQVRLTLFGQ